MTTGDKESKEILVFVVALANLLADAAGKNPLALIGSLGSFLKVLQLASPAFSGWQAAAAEAGDGFSDAEKADLGAVIESLKLPNESVEKVVESVLKAGVALADIVAHLRGVKAA